MGQSKNDVSRFLAWRKKKRSRVIEPRFPRPYGAAMSERIGANESSMQTLFQMFSFGDSARGAHFEQPCED